MDVARPYSAINGGIDGEVLVVLSGLRHPVTGRKVARMVRRGSQPAVNTALERLVSLGIVSMTVAPPAHLYALNREHVGAGAVEAMAGMRSDFFARLRASLATAGKELVHASVFGSMARATGDETSDIDLLVVWHSAERGDDHADYLTSLADEVQLWTGNSLNVAEFWSGQLADPDVSKAHAFFGAVLEDSIHVHGVRLEDLLGRR